MPYGDLSYFMPGKSFFKEPGQYERALKSEATKKASYMADIEQFYTQLEESARQFDVGLGESGRQFDVGLEEGGRQFDVGLEEGGRQFDLNLALQEAGLSQQASQFAEQQAQQKSMFRDQFWGQMGAGALNTALQSYLKNKDITFGFEWAEDMWDKISGTDAIADFDLDPVISADPGMWYDPEDVQWPDLSF